MSVSLSESSICHLFHPTASPMLSVSEHLRKPRGDPKPIGKTKAGIVGKTWVEEQG